MMTIMLIAHVLVALALTVLTLMTLFGALRASTSFAARFLMPSLVMTAGTGVALAVVAPMTFGRFCVSMTIATVGVLVVRHYYEKRLPKSI